MTATVRRGSWLHHHRGPLSAQRYQTVKRKWRHVCITENDISAASLRNQTLSKPPKKVLIYSAVFDLGIGYSPILKHMEAFNDHNEQAVSWLHAIGACWEITSNTTFVINKATTKILRLTID